MLDKSQRASAMDKKLRHNARELFHSQRTDKIGWKARPGNELASCTLELMKIFLFSLTFLALVAGCGPQFYLPESKERPAQIVVSAYTQNGCFEELQEEAKRQGVEVKLKSVETDLSQQILLFPFYKGYKCTGEVTSPSKSTSRPPHLLPPRY